jgi:surface protein
MSTFGDLKDYSIETIQFDDQRPADIIFDNPFPDDIELTSEDLVITVDNPYGIEEIVNVDVAQPFYSIDVSFFPGTTVAWDFIPDGLTVTESNGVYSIGPFLDIETYEQIRYPTITIPEEFQGVFFYFPSIDFTTPAGPDSYSWQVGVFVPVGQLFGKFEINANFEVVVDAGKINLEAFVTKLTVFTLKEELEATLNSNFGLEVDFDVRKDLIQLNFKSQIVAKPRLTYPLLNTAVDPTHPDWRTTEGARLEYQFIPNVGIVTDVGPLESMTRMFRGEFTGSRKTFNDISVTGWDVSTVKTMDFAFFNTTFNRQISNWNTSSVTNMSNMFRQSLFNQPINTWNVSSVTNMREMFRQTSFNRPLDNWNVSKVTDMREMFQDSLFDQLINNWDVSAVTAMTSMFRQTPFNQQLNNWNVSKVTNMSSMFQNAANFNQPLDNWNVSQVTNMASMFQDSLFNQPINNWNVSKVTLMNNMFQRTPFNQPLNSLNVSQVTNMSAMFNAATAFNQPLNNWNVSKVTTANQMFLDAAAFDQNIGNLVTAIPVTLFGSPNQPADFSTGSPIKNKPTFKPFLADGVTRINT